MCPPLPVQIFPSSIRKHEWFTYVNVAWGYLRLLRAPFLSCLVQMCQQGNLFVPLFLTSFFSYLSTITFDLPFLISIFFKYACADMGDIFVSQLLSLDSYLPVFWTKQFLSFQGTFQLSILIIPLHLCAGRWIINSNYLSSLTKYMKESTNLKPFDNLDIFSIS